MLELVICDDEKIFRNDLKTIVQTELDLAGIPFHLTEFTCGEDLLASVTSHDFHIIFLDIEMGRLDGLSTAKKIREQNTSAVIIFVTSHPDFVFQGYEVRALNYVLKPYKKDKIRSVLHTALEEANVPKERYYIVEQRGSSIRLLLSKVKYFTSEKRFVTAVTVDSSYIFYEKLNDLEQNLPDCFIRIHNRYLINLNHLEAIDNNTAVVAGEQLPVSRSCKQELMTAFAKYILK